MTPSAGVARAQETKFKIPVSTAVLGLLVTLLSFVVGFSFHNGQTEQKVAQHDTALQEKVGKDEFREFSKRMDQGMESIQGQLREIEDRIDQKEGKRH